MDMKKNTFTNRHAAVQFSSLVIASCAMAFTMNSCQDYEYGFTEEEIHQTAVQRHYKEEFHKQFPEVDPHHTWMYEPVQTFVTDNGSPLTRAGISEPVIQDFSSVKDSALRIEANVVDAILNYMGEAQNNYGQITKNFEYLAVTETTYDIWPVLWGEKFCSDNNIGIYVVNSDGSIKDLGTLWSDTYENVLMGYKDQTQNIKNSTRPVNRDITKSWKDGTMPTMDYVRSTTECDACHGTGKVDQKCNGTVRLKNNGKYVCESCGHEYSRSEYNNLARKNNNSKYCSQSVKVECGTCHGTGTKTQTDKVNPEYYLFPHYKVTMPAGTKWGIYLTTRKQQNYTPTVTWYSNPRYNNGNDGQNLSNIIAAGTFTFGGVTYCCFEDAPCGIDDKGFGWSVNGYQGFDHDYNDFMLRITPRPVESTYNSSDVRIMCEDLGGTFDWDFNDIVYDLKFEQGIGNGVHAFITITLQAVGGTLPIHMFYGTEDLGELHEVLGNQRMNPDGLFTPINVSGGQTVSSPKVLKKIDLGKETMEDGYDFRQIVHNISLGVCENHYSTRAGETVSDISESSHVINFPDANGDKAPQCFMSSVGTEWADECVNITKKYATFNDWVKNQAQNNDWSSTQF